MECESLGLVRSLRAGRGKRDGVERDASSSSSSHLFSCAHEIASKQIFNGIVVVVVCSLYLQNLLFHGVMRFYFQDAGQKVATKCIRVASDATVTDVIGALK